MIVGAVEEMCIQTFLGFYKLGYLSGTDSGEPISCPFDKRREGIIFSEGSAVFIIEELNVALERKAHIYAEILGIGSNFDPYRLHKFNPKGKGIISVMKSTLESASVIPREIDCIFANANSTQDADLVETKAIKEVFGNHSRNLLITAVKSMFGETFSAAGALSLSAAIGSIEEDSIPPTINLKDKDRQCDLDYVPNTSRKQTINKAMIDCFGPNGANSVLVIGKYN
jgi:3-oxoacyl-(acyl-carrier-protein) synthase